MSHISGFLPIHINGNQTFLVDGEILSAYSARLKKLIKQERSRTTAQIKNSGIEINDFPGGPDGFELVIRFCYNNGRITTNVSNVSLLHCSALFLGMTEKLSPCNLLQQTQNFLEGIFEWSLKDTLICLRSCHSFFNFADSSGLVDKLICALLSKIAQNSDSSSSSSPETASGGLRLLYSCKNTRESIKPSSSSRAWWFDDVAILPPKIIEKLFQSLGAYGADNNSLILTRFLLHYLKLSAQRKSNHIHASPSAMSSKYDEFGGLADTAVHGVILVGKKTFSCRALFWVLRFVSGFGLSKEYRLGLERLIGGMLDEATLDDLLVSGHERGVYDVNLVIRLIKVFAKSDGVSLQKLKKVGRLIDKYLGEISPDQNLKISKFLGVAESLPDSARDSFDGTFRAIDIYLDSHPNLSFEERSRLCRCLNYEKLSLEACKELAKNPKIPPRVAIQALMSQQKNVTPTNQFENYESPRSTSTTPTTTSASDSHSNSNSNSNSNSQSRTRMVLYKGGVDHEEMRSSAELETVDTILSLQKMQWRVVELEKLCRQMKGQMSRMIKQNHVLTTPNS